MKGVPLRGIWSCNKDAANQAGANVPSSLAERSYCRRQFFSCVGLDDIASAAGLQSRFAYIWRAFLSQKADLRLGRDIANALSSLDPVEPRQSNVQKNQVQAEIFSPLSRFVGLS